MRRGKRPKPKVRGEGVVRVNATDASNSGEVIQRVIARCVRVLGLLQVRVACYYLHTHQGAAKRIESRHDYTLIGQARALGQGDEAQGRLRRVLVRYLWGGTSDPISSRQR